MVLRRQKVSLNFVIFDSGNNLTPNWRQAIALTSLDVLSVRPSWTDFGEIWIKHYGDVIMGAIASQITSLTIVYSTVHLDADLRKRQSSASLAFVRGIHRWPVNSPHKWPVTRKMISFDDVIMNTKTLNQKMQSKIPSANWCFLCFMFCCCCYCFSSMCLAAAGTQIFAMCGACISDKTYIILCRG